MIGDFWSVWSDCDFMSEPLDLVRDTPSPSELTQEKADQTSDHETVVTSNVIEPPSVPSVVEPSPKRTLPVCPVPHPRHNCSYPYPCEVPDSVNFSRRRRANYTKEQIQIFENFFKTCHYPDIAMREELSIISKVPESRIQVWFQNRRAKYRRQLNEQMQNFAFRMQHNKQKDKPGPNFARFASSLERTESLSSSQTQPQPNGPFIQPSRIANPLLPGPSRLQTSEKRPIEGGDSEPPNKLVCLSNPETEPDSANNLFRFSKQDEIFSQNRFETLMNAATSKPQNPTQNAQNVSSLTQNTFQQPAMPTMRQMPAPGTSQGMQMPYMPHPGMYHSLGPNGPVMVRMQNSDGQFYYVPYPGPMDMSNAQQSAQKN